MRLLHAGTDITVIALWLGHESVTTTQIYLQADMALKQQALDRTTPLTTPPGRYRHPTNCWPSWKPSDYADIPGPPTPAHQHPRPQYRHNRGIGVMGQAAPGPGPLP